MLKELISKIINLEDLEFEVSRTAMEEIMCGSATDAQIAAFITALRMKGESIDEITGFAEVMREKCVRIEPKVRGSLVDVCGTGGAKLKTFNISTISAFVVAGSNVFVAKHGNRSFTSKCGSADLVEALGVNLEAEPKEIERAIEEIGIGFLFAPKFHPAMKYAAKPRKEIGLRTVFNILGPLTNPAGAKAQLIGVFNEELVKKLPPVLNNLRLEHALVV
ncbi:MAG: anthranilate phosphoribosyltransferase, partial [Candidatus Thermoplasmatota archaeon]